MYDFWVGNYAFVVVREMSLSATVAAGGPIGQSFPPGSRFPFMLLIRLLTLALFSSVLAKGCVVCLPPALSF